MTIHLSSIRHLTFVALVAPALTVGSLSAQDVEERFPGVRLGIVYDPASAREAIAIQPFSVQIGGEAVAGSIEAILGRDLRYTDRFAIVDSLPRVLAGTGVEYGVWDELGANYLVTGDVRRVDGGYELALAVHDVVYGTLEDQARFRIPDPDDENFRMAVHIASDAVVRWITGEPGMAASRIVFARTGQAKELWVVDSDGENLRRITRFGSITLSPAWSPDGRRVLYTSYKGGYQPRLFEMNLQTGAERVIDPGVSGLLSTPTYHPNGAEIAFAVIGGSSPGVYRYNLAQQCCLQRLSGDRRYDDISPTFAPDGQRMAFMSNRLAGTASPQIHVMSAQGGDPDLVSPYDYQTGGYYTSPDWSPVGDRLVFHGRIQRGRYHILVADVGAGGRRLTQLTSEGNNEDPSWAPDGRHIVFVGERRRGYGLMVVDALTGATRTLVSGIRANVPAWSGSLEVPTQEALRSRPQ